MNFFVDHKATIDFIQRLRSKFNRPGSLFLIGETSQVLEGWRERADEFTYTAKVAPGDREFFDNAIQKIAKEMDVEINEEHPATLIPLPKGYEDRAIRVNENILNPQGDLANAALEIFHFDPYSVSFRYISRGDEPDYHIALYYLQHGWVTVEKMETLLENLLPEFSLKTIAQDPAEFRRKYKGLLQMWRAIPAGVTHRPTPA